MTDGNDPSAQRPTKGGATSPDPIAPGDRDLPWKATAERRDLWGPIEKPLEGTVHSPASRELARSRRRPLVSFGVPLLVGGLAGLGSLAVGLATALAAPVILAGAALGIGVIAAGGSGLALRAGSRAEHPQLTAAATIPGSTLEILEQILRSTADLRSRTAALRPRASDPAAALVLDDIDALLGRIDALTATETIQAQRRSAGELTMLEGMATRYLPNLVGAADDTIGFLATFSGGAREEALANLENIDRQLGVLGEGLERIEKDIVKGVSRDLEVHAEFLRTRFADHHLNPIIDV